MRIAQYLIEHFISLYTEWLDDKTDDKKFISSSVYSHSYYTKVWQFFVLFAFCIAKRMYMK